MLSRCCFHRWHAWSLLLIPMVAWTAMATQTAAAEPSKTIRVGIIGLDTSHAIAFTKLLNKDNNTGDMAGVRVVAGFPGGSPDIPSSADRVEGYTEQLRKMGVEIAPSIDALLTKVDAVLLESVDGRPHLEQVRPVLAAGKPVFIDKPVAGSLADAIEVYRLAAEKKVPCFSSSSTRFGPKLQALIKDAKLLPIQGCDAFSPCHLEEHHPDLFWYGIHGVEILYTVMGRGCKTVSRVQAEGAEIAVGVWGDGRVGVFRGITGKPATYGATIFGVKPVESLVGFEGYDPLVVAICKFFKTGVPPVTAEETIELCAFMEAADESKRQGGCPVSIESVMAKARQQNADQRK
jgi:hypothetical protein